MCLNPQPACCGNLNRVGDCPGHCAIPERCGECAACAPELHRDEPDEHIEGDGMGYPFRPEDFTL